VDANGSFVVPHAEDVNTVICP